MAVKVSDRGGKAVFITDNEVSTGLGRCYLKLRYHRRHDDGVIAGTTHLHRKGVNHVLREDSQVIMLSGFQSYLVGSKSILTRHNIDRLIMTGFNRAIRQFMFLYELHRLLLELHGHHHLATVGMAAFLGEKCVIYGLQGNYQQYRKGNYEGDH